MSKFSEQIAAFHREWRDTWREWAEAREGSTGLSGFLEADSPQSQAGRGEPFSFNEWYQVELEYILRDELLRHAAKVLRCQSDDVWDDCDNLVVREANVEAYQADTFRDDIRSHTKESSNGPTIKLYLPSQVPTTDR